MNGMMLHCGADPLSRDDVAAVPVPAPMGPLHVVRPFAEDIDLVSEHLNSLGLTIQSEAYGMTRDDRGFGQRFFGLMEVAGGTDDFGLMVGMRGSYNQTLVRGLAVGSRVFVCDNLAFSGQVELHTKQTTKIGQRLPEMLRSALDQVPELAGVQQEKFDGYRNHNVTKRIGDAMLVEMLRRDVLNTQQLGRALAEWDNPSHPEHAEQGYSLWRLHNAVTEAVKPKNGRNALLATWDRTTGLTGMLDEVRENGYPIYH